MAGIGGGVCGSSLDCFESGDRPYLSSFKDKFAYGQRAGKEISGYTNEN